MGTNDKARTRLNPPLGCRDKPVPTNQELWDANMDGVPDDVCIQFDFNRNGVSSDFSDRARMTLEGGKQWTYPCVWPWPSAKTCSGAPGKNYRTVAYPWASWVWWLGHQCLGPDQIKGTADDDKNACWFTKFASRPP